MPTRQRDVTTTTLGAMRKGGPKRISATAPKAATKTGRDHATYRAARRNAQRTGQRGGIGPNTLRHKGASLARVGRTTKPPAYGAGKSRG